jgi:hypothetical protein
VLRSSKILGPLPGLALRSSVPLWPLAPVASTSSASASSTFASGAGLLLFRVVSDEQHMMRLVAQLPVKHESHDGLGGRTAYLGKPNVMSINVSRRISLKEYA